MKWSIKTYSIYFISLAVCSWMWIGMEYVFDGKVIPSNADTIILIILCYFITDKINQYINNQIK